MTFALRQEPIIEFHQLSDSGTELLMTLFDFSKNTQIICFEWIWVNDIFLNFKNFIYKSYKSIEKYLLILISKVVYKMLTNLIFSTNTFEWYLKIVYNYKQWLNYAFIHLQCLQALRLRKF
jgi:hypothetical protein